MERKYPPGIWLHWPDSMAGDERGVVLGALESGNLLNYIVKLFTTLRKDYKTII